MQPLVLAITGASGVVYGVRLLEVLVAAGRDVFLTISPAAQLVLETELGIKVDLARFSAEELLNRKRLEAATIDRYQRQIHYCHFQDLMAPIASGSFLTDGMVICPCSGSTLAAVAHAMGSNLIHRAAEVHLKERRKLILMPREMPLSLPQIDNLRKAAEAGAVVLPASPGFYQGPKSVDDLVDFVVARICDQLGVEHRLTRRWGV
ncbi:MAG TPA: flavin prenyltransferase UbiX [Pirellulales bacterium]|nr:flavin prenyltransferase UbiX [Pirellulales bacterium]